MSKKASLATRIRRCGGVRNFLSFWVRSNFDIVWNFVQSVPGLSGPVNQYFTARMLSGYNSAIPRIPRMNLDHDYPSFEGMYDESRTVYGRVLPRDPEYTKKLPDLDSVVSCFEREEFIPESNRNVTLLIAYYAQWFSHQFFNTNPESPTHTNQPVGLNLSQLYGSSKEIEDRLRLYKDGLFKSCIRHDQEFPEITEIEPNCGDQLLKGTHKFELPIPLANAVPGFAAIHVLFFRHHQYVARELKKASIEKGVSMDDEEIFQKAKLIVTISMLKLTMVDYVGGSLQSSNVTVKFDLDIKSKRVFKMFAPKYYPPINAIQTEFNFLYRWHQFYPDQIKVLKTLPSTATVPDLDAADCETLELPDEKTPLDEKWNSVHWLTATSDGLERLLLSASSTRAGKLTLMNTNSWLAQHVVRSGLEKTREYQMASYNDYREYFGFARVKRFEDITDNKRLVDKLKEVYKTVDDIEYYVGIFAEEKEFGGIHGPFLATIGVGFTFTGIFASRIFETGLISEDTLTKRGMELIDEFTYIRDFTKKHTKLGDIPVGFTVPQGKNKKN